MLCSLGKSHWRLMAYSRSRLVGMGSRSLFSGAYHIGACTHCNTRLYMKMNRITWSGGCLGQGEWEKREVASFWHICFLIISILCCLIEKKKHYFLMNNSKPLVSCFFFFERKNKNRSKQETASGLEMKLYIVPSIWNGKIWGGEFLFTYHSDYFKQFNHGC